MVKIFTLDAITANVTETTFAQRFILAEGPLRLQEIVSILSSPARLGRSWTLSISTSDLAAALFAVLCITFAIDHYLFESRYLVHIRGIKRAGVNENTSDKKAHNGEKGIFDVESGCRCNEAMGGDSKVVSNRSCCESPAHSRSAHKFRSILCILGLVILSSGGWMADLWLRHNHKESTKLPRTNTESKARGNAGSTTSWMGAVFRIPWLERLSSWAMVLFFFLLICALFLYNLLFWPMILTLHILLQCALQGDLNPGVPIPYQAITLKSIFYLTSWTAVGVTVMLTQNRARDVLWKVVRWTHAVNWWLFWAVLEFADVYGWVVNHGNSYKIARAVTWFTLRPSLVTYLYSGTVINVVIDIRMFQYFWKVDTLNPKKKCSRCEGEK